MGQKNSPLFLFLLCLIVLAAPVPEGRAAGANLEVARMAQVTATGMSIKSPSFGTNGYIPEEFSCKGRNISPQLMIENVPRGTRSLALVVDDPDAPGGIFVHWVMWDIPPETRQIPAGSVPKGAVQGMNSWKKAAYGGPCPPSGVHHYFFKLYALDTKKLSPGHEAGKEELEAAMQGHIIAQTELVGLFRK